MASSPIVGSTFTPQTNSAYDKGVAPSDELYKDEFMTLLLTQMQYQDPLNPLGNAEFLSQLSQFSQLEQLYNVNQNIQKLVSSQDSVTNSLLTNLLGKTVKIEGKNIQLTDSAGLNLSYELMDRAQKVTITIYDAKGNKIKSIEKINQEGGLHEILWDGTDEAGKAVAEGNYTFEVTAYNGEESIWVKPYMEGLVEGISFSEASGPVVLVDDQKVPISQILQIRVTEASS